MHGIEILLNFVRKSLLLAKQSFLSKTKLDLFSVMAAEKHD